MINSLEYYVFFMTTVYYKLQPYFKHTYLIYIPTIIMKITIRFLH